MGGKGLGRMSKSAAVYIPVGALLIIFLTILGTSGFLRVMQIEVVGATVYPENEIVVASGISKGDNLLFVDASAAGRRVKAAMPYIDVADITRLPPDRIRIEVTESTAMATVTYQFETLVIDLSGRVLQRGGDIPEGLIEVRGFSPGDVVEGSALRAQTGSETYLQFLLDVLAAFDKEGIQEGVSYLDMTNISNITFGYHERYRVILGAPNNLRQKLASLPGAIAVVDTREPASATGTFRVEDSGEWRWNRDN